MILALRIRQLADQLRANTLRAAETHRHGAARVATVTDVDPPERHHVRCLERLGYAVTLRRAA